MTDRRSSFTDAELVNTAATSGSSTTVTVSLPRLAAYGFGFAFP